jgi:hypothetical protein
MSVDSCAPYAYSLRAISVNPVFSVVLFFYHERRSEDSGLCPSKAEGAENTESHRGNIFILQW